MPIAGNKKFNKPIPVVNFNVQLDMPTIRKKLTILVTVSLRPDMPYTKAKNKHTLQLLHARIFATASEDIYLDV